MVQHRVLTSDPNPDPGADVALRRVERLRERDQQFQESLKGAEECFAAPVSGTNAAEWIERGAAAFDELRPLLQRARAQHRGALAQIAAEDIGLQPRIDEMRAAEGLLEQKEGELAAQFTALRQRVSNGDTDAGAWQTALEQLSREGLEWVSGVREQDLAVRTWLTEALTRDRGVVD